MIGIGLQIQQGLYLLWLSSESNKKFKKIKISNAEWSLLAEIHSYLKNFKRLTDLISGEKYVTLPLVVVAFWRKFQWNSQRGKGIQCYSYGRYGSLWDSHKILYETSLNGAEWRSELNDYLALTHAKQGEQILDWWKARGNSLPGLFKMARDFFSIMATSVPVKRLFSKAGSIVTKKRNSLNYESIKALI